MMEIALCRAYNEPETSGTMVGCRSAIQTTTGVWVCRNDFHLKLVEVCGPRDCKHKDVRELR